MQKTNPQLPSPACDLKRIKERATKKQTNHLPNKKGIIAAVHSRCQCVHPSPTIKLFTVFCKTEFSALKNKKSKTEPDEGAKSPSICNVQTPRPYQDDTASPMMRKKKKMGNQWVENRSNTVRE